MSYLKRAAIAAYAVVLLIAGQSTEAAVVGDPGSLHPSSIVIDFEGIPVGTAEPIIVGGVTISTFNREVNNDPREVADPTASQLPHPGIFEGHYFGPGRHDFLIEFATPVSQFGLGVHDPNFDGNTLLAFDSMGNLLESATSAAGDPIFPTGPIGGSHSTFVGFVRPTADIAKVQLSNVFSALHGKTDLLGIDTVTYFDNGGMGAVPEPGSVALLGIGCLAAGIAWTKTRRARVA